MTSPDRVQCKFSSFQSTQPFSLLINSSLLISFHKSVASLLTCKRPFINEEIHTNFFFILNPSCNLLANTFKFTNPLHIHKNRSMIQTLPFKYADSILTKTDKQHQTKLPTYIQGIITNPTKWDTYLDHINDTLNIHSNTFRFIPIVNISTMVIIGFILACIIAIVCYIKILKSKQHKNNLQKIPCTTVREIISLTNSSSNPQHEPIYDVPRH